MKYTRGLLRTYTDVTYTGIVIEKDIHEIVYIPVLP